MVSPRFAEALSGEQEIRVTVARRKDGKLRTLPIWFTVEGERLLMLPMHGLKTRWFLDLEEQDGAMTVEVKENKVKVVVKVILDAGSVEEVKKGFSQKYGEDDVKRYYPTSEVALEIKLG